jgi:2-oxoglutarate dehydrogenase complex dehydrogenase (E1) component-like enzyme
MMMPRSGIGYRLNTSYLIVSTRSPGHVLYKLTELDTAEELDNRNKNAPLLRYVESVRRHGHRAAQIDPLDLMDRE